jgi:hypothetical protein
VREDAGQRCGKTETVGQHVLGTRLAKLALKKSIAVEYLPKDRLSRGRIHVALFHRRARRKPPARGNICLQTRIIRRPVFLHHAITIRAAEVEDVIRILVEQCEVIVQRLGNVLVDDARILPTPLRIEMRVSNDVECRFFRQVGLS